MADNSGLAVRLEQFKNTVKGKNPLLGQNMGRAIISVLEATVDLESASRETLLALKGVGPSNVDYVLRLIQGEDVATVAKDAPVTTRHHQALGPHYRDTGEWSGSWDNAVKRYEGD